MLPMAAVCQLIRGNAERGASGEVTRQPPRDHRRMKTVLPVSFPGPSMFDKNSLPMHDPLVRRRWISLGRARPPSSEAPESMWTLSRQHGLTRSPPRNYVSRSPLSETVPNGPKNLVANQDFELQPGTSCMSTPAPPEQPASAGLRLDRGER